MSQLKPQIPEIGSKFLIVEQFKKAAQQYAKAMGFAFRDKYRNNYKITEETQKRKKFTKRQNCSVSLRAVLNENVGVWIVTSYKSQHDHKLLSLLKVYCFQQYQVLNTKQKELVYLMLRSGISTQSIANTVHWKNGVVYTKDIINEYDQIKNTLNKGSNNNTTIRLLKMLKECQYIIWHLLSKDKSIQNLFFTHIEAACQVTMCPEVLIVDAIYKTNLYKLPLINIVGTIYDAFSCSPEVFVSDKDLVLQKATNNVFPIAKKYKDYDKFLLSVQTIAYSEKISEVEKAFDEMKQAITKSKNPIYIQSYLEKWKKDANALKKAIKAASGLEQVFSHINRAFCQHKLQTNDALGLNFISADSFILNNKRFEQLLGKISNKALYKLEEKYESLSDCESKAIFLHKIEALAAEENIIPKAPLRV
ncbi:22310_t:CDS:2, partial [Dentiscutata erythropus]